MYAAKIKLYICNKNKYARNFGKLNQVCTLTLLAPGRGGG